VGDDELLAWILGRSDEVASDGPGAELTDEQIVAILAGNAAYEESIGAIGPAVAG